MAAERFVAMIREFRYTRVKEWIDYETEKIICLESKEFNTLENLINDLYLFIEECC